MSTYPEQRPEEREPVPDDDGDDEHLIRPILEKAPSFETALEVASLYEHHGVALTIYLSLDGTDAYADDVAEQFYKAYIGMFTNRHELFEYMISDYQWDLALEKLVAEHTMPKGLVTQDYATLFGYLAATNCTIVDYRGRLYVYSR